MESSYDKMCHDLTFDRGCNITLDMEISNKLFPFSFSIYRKLSNSTVM